MGSAALYQLAKRGVRVLGIDRFSPPHDQGSTHGDTRITRLAVGEGEHYTPLVRRSHEIWREIEAETDAELLTQCGGLFISSAHKQSKTHVEGFFDTTVAAARRFGIAHELLDAAAIRRRFPQFAVRDDEYGYYEPSAGHVRPEACVAAQLALAERHGAEIRRGETVTALDGLVTDKGRYDARQVIVTAGAWAPSLLPLPFLKIHRQVLVWFDCDAARFRDMPVFIWEHADRSQGIYGFPAIDGPGGGIKVATEAYETTVSPDAVPRKVSAEETAAMHRDLIAPFMPGVGPRVVRTATCLYTVTPDHGFVIDRLPGHERIILASPCSGHGFKHSAAIGEALADLATLGRSRHDLSPFGISRFVS